MDHRPKSQINNVKLQEEDVEGYIHELGVGKDLLTEPRKR